MVLPFKSIAKNKKGAPCWFQTHKKSLLKMHSHLKTISFPTRVYFLGLVASVCVAYL
jgi:hypothetical protein